MNKYHSSIISKLRRAVFVGGLLIIALAGFSFLTESGETQAVFGESEQKSIVR